ncbi:hypothetical protein V6Z12_D04G094700 [Gossypium hirsutum]
MLPDFYLLVSKFLLAISDFRSPPFQVEEHRVVSVPYQSVEDSHSRSMKHLSNSLGSRS